MDLPSQDNDLNNVNLFRDGDDSSRDDNLFRDGDDTSRDDDVFRDGNDASRDDDRNYDNVFKDNEDDDDFRVEACICNSEPRNPNLAWTRIRVQAGKFYLK